MFKSTDMPMCPRTGNESLQEQAQPEQKTKAAGGMCVWVGAFGFPKPPVRPKFDPGHTRKPQQPSTKQNDKKGTETQTPHGSCWVYMIHERERRPMHPNAALSCRDSSFLLGPLGGLLRCVLRCVHRCVRGLRLSVGVVEHLGPPTRHRRRHRIRNLVVGTVPRLEGHPGDAKPEVGELPEPKRRPLRAAQRVKHALRHQHGARKEGGAHLAAACCEAACCEAAARGEHLVQGALRGELLARGDHVGGARVGGVTGDGGGEAAVRLLRHDGVVLFEQLGDLRFEEGDEPLAEAVEQRLRLQDARHRRRRLVVSAQCPRAALKEERADALAIVLIGLEQVACGVAEHEAFAEVAEVGGDARAEAAADGVPREHKWAALVHLEKKVRDLRLPQVLRVREAGLGCVAEAEEIERQDAPGRLHPSGASGS
mmetsp:Transcript_31859/g.71715  ORF Transcript_31859/g.71715 Transcript_31859/m.71715 type:complete len:426 (+) Transcript_31859:42-1319(+)